MAKALDATQPSLAGIQLPSTRPLDVQPIVSPQDISGAQVRAAQNVQAGLSTFGQVYDMTQKIDQDARRQRLQRNLDNKLPRDATALDLQILDSFNAEVGGELPTYVDADGRQVYDMQAIRNLMSNKRALQFEAEGGFSTGKMTPFQEASLSYLTKSGYLAAAFDQNGNLKSDQDLHKAISEVPRVKPDDAVAVQDSINEMETVLERIQSAKKLATADNVGPVSGNPVARKYQYLRAMVGGDPTRYKEQRELEIFLSKEALKAAQSMKGAMSDRDIEFLLNSVPKLKDDEAVWENYLDTLESTTQQALENRRNGVYFPPGASTPTDVSTGAPVGGGGSLPAAPDGAPDYSRFDQMPARASVPNSVLVRSQLSRGAKGEPVITLPDGRRKVVPDSLFNWIFQQQRNLGTPKPSGLQNVQVTTGLQG